MESSPEKSSQEENADKTVKKKLEFDMEDVKKHTTMDDLWVVIHGKVYNATPFLDDHPGGPEILKENAGTDVTEEFEEVYHTDSARKTLETLFIGHLKGYDPDVELDRIKAHSNNNSNFFILISVIIIGIAAYAIKAYMQ